MSLDDSPRGAAFTRSSETRQLSFTADENIVDEIEQLQARLEAYPDVPTSPHTGDLPRSWVLEAILLDWFGRTYEDFTQTPVREKRARAIAEQLRENRENW